MREIKKRFEGIILAAGLSMRMNEWKPEVKIDGVPIIIHSINSMIQHCDKIIIVGGFNFSGLEYLIEKYSSSFNGKKENISIVENKKYLNGMLSSVKCGLSFVDEAADGIFILPGDMPFVSEQTFSSMILQFLDEKIEVFLPAVALDSSNGNVGELIKKGHPVLIKSGIVKKVLEDEHEIIFRNILKKYRQKICLVEDEGICLDIDDNIDFIKAEKYFEKLKLKKEALSD